MIFIAGTSGRVGKAIGVVAAIVVLMVVPSGASAATVRCRIEKPARVTYKGQQGQVLKLSDLTATNLPQRHTYGGSPCATANAIAWTWEFQVGSQEAEYEPAPEAIATDDDELTRAPPLTWRIKKSYGGEDGPECQRSTETFRHGHQRVAVRVLEEIDGKPCGSEHLAKTEETLSPCQEEELQGLRLPHSCPEGTT